MADLHVTGGSKETPSSSSSLLPLANANHFGHTVPSPLTPHHYSGLKQITALAMNMNEDNRQAEMKYSVRFIYLTFVTMVIYIYKIKVCNS